MKLHAYALLFFTVILPGCASVFFNDYKQVVLIQSDPPGADIFTEDGIKLGTTPAYVKIRRATEATLKVRSNGGEIRSVNLESHYRWSPSFYGNLVYLTAAPIGWGVDYLTKTAFQFDNPNPVVFNDKSKGKFKVRPPLLIIAPPQAEFVSLSREVADTIEEELKRRLPKSRIANFNRTRPVFAKYHYRNDSVAPEEFLYKILYELDADQIAESTVEETSFSVRVKVQVSDAFTRRPIESFYLEKPKPDYRIFRKTGFERILARNFTFAPNAVGIDFTTYNSTFELSPETPTFYGQTTVNGSRVNPRGIDRLLSLVGALNVLYVRPPRAGRGWKWSLMFVPSIYASAVTFTYPQLSDIQDVEFRRFRLGLGYGPQVSVSSRYGTLYLSLIPTFNYTRIDWNVNQDARTVQIGESLIQTEVGYQLFLSDSLAFRFFAKSWSENAGRWGEILTQARATQTNLSAASVSLAGLSLIWYWPAMQAKAVEWFSFE